MAEKTDFILEVEKVANLAKLELSAEKKERFAREIESVLEHFQDINQLEIDSVETLDHYSLAENQARKDEKMDFPSEGREKIKEAFPERSGDCLKVKAVL